MGGFTYTHVCIWGNAMSNKNNTSKIPSLNVLSLYVVSPVQDLIYIKEKKQRAKEKERVCFGI